MVKLARFLMQSVCDSSVSWSYLHPADHGMINQQPEALALCSALYFCMSADIAHAVTALVLNM